MKKIIILSIILSLVGLGSLYIVKLTGKYRNTDTIMNRAVLTVFNCNNIIVRGDDLQNITIKWDCDFFDWRVIYKDGRLINSIKNTYGPQRFEIFYKGEFICKVSQFKYAWWLTYDYYFTIIKENAQLKCSANIIGPDGAYKVHNK